MAFDKEKNASRVRIEVTTAKNNGYSGNDLLRIAEQLKINPSISEEDLAKAAHVDAGYNNSGIGDLKRLIISIWNTK